MNAAVRYLGRTGASVLLIALAAMCKKDDTGNLTLKTGNWYGSDISFVVNNEPLRIADLEFSYSGHATGTLCSYDYESGASFATVSNIENNLFNAEISTFTISGIFPTDSTATIEITWSAYDSGCDAYKTGSKTYTAGYNLIGK